MTKSDFDKHVYGNFKNQHIFKLLVSDPEFLKDVEEIRKKTGLDKYTGKDPLYWHVRAEKMTDEILSKKEFWERGKAIQKDPSLTFLEKKKKKYELDGELPTNYLNRFCLRMIKKYNLPNNFHTAINSFVISGSENIWGGVIPYKFDRVRGLDGEYIKNQLDIKIYQKLSAYDLEMLVYAIKEEMVGLPDYREIKDLDTKLAIEEAYDKKEGNLYEEEPITNEDLAEEYLHDKKRKDEVYEMMRSLRKARDKYIKLAEKSSEENYGTER